MLSDSTSSKIQVSAQRFNTVALTAIALLALLFIFYAAHDRKTSMAEGQRMVDQIAGHTALIAEGTLDSTQRLLLAMAALVRPPTLNEAPNAAKLRTALLQLRGRSHYIMDLLILGRQGKIVHWTGTGAPPMVTDRSYYTAHLRNATAGVHITEPLLSKVQKDRWVVGVSEALRNDQGELETILVAIIDIAALQEKLIVPFTVPGATQALISNEGTVYARNPDHFYHVGKKIARSRELTSLSESNPTLTIIAASQLDHRERILSFHQLKDFPLVAVGSIMVDEMLAEWRERLYLLLLVWIAAATAIFVVFRRANAISRAQVELASIDELTGVANRRSIMQAASTLERSKANAGSLSLMMLDIDHFKSINDRFGHQVGDDVIRLVSGVLRSQIRTTDFLGRYGGEEFLILMPDTGIEGAAQVAEKLRRAVAEKVTRPVTVTISIGVATTTEYDVTLDRTLTRADHALYRAKESGRNRVEVALEELPRIDL